MDRISLTKPDLNKINSKGYRAVDMHVHTVYSDGLATLDYLAMISKNLSLGFAITDHMTIKGALKMPKNIFFIPGIR